MFASQRIDMHTEITQRHSQSRRAFTASTTASTGASTSYYTYYYYVDISRCGSHVLVLPLKKILGKFGHSRGAPSAC